MHQPNADSNVWREVYSSILKATPCGQFEIGSRYCDKTWLATCVCRGSRPFVAPLGSIADDFSAGNELDE